MTQRERQLLEWIRENPMISQQELAEKAGITRSSAAVHISSLMKKGYIVGRGYLLRTDPYIVVVGGVNMDIGADGVYLVGEATGFIGAGSCIRRGCARSSCEAASRASACAAQRRTDCDRITLHCRRRRREH